MLAAAGEPLVTVGDVVTYHVLEAGVVPFVALVDDRTERTAVDDRVADRVAAATFDREVTATNPAATLTAELLSALRAALDSDETTLVGVDGEEDLATLPAVVAAPANGSVVYGQPGEGWCSCPSRAQHGSGCGRCSPGWTATAGGCSRFSKANHRLFIRGSRQHHCSRDGSTRQGKVDSRSRNRRGRGTTPLHLPRLRDRVRGATPQLPRLRELRYPSFEVGRGVINRRRADKYACAQRPCLGRRSRVSVAVRGAVRSVAVRLDDRTAQATVSLEGHID
jgi:Uncharacterized protein conserved in archaea